MQTNETIAAFYRQQVERCEALGIPAGSFAVSHLAIRVPSWNDYVQQRTEWEEQSSGNLENVWNGRPISKLMLRHPLAVSDSASVPLIELIPPYHQRIYKMGLEHIGFVVGDGHEEFIAEHFDTLTGRQFQSPVCSPAYILFDDYTHVKFYRWSLGDVCMREGQNFDSIQHAEWPDERQASEPYNLVDGWTA